MLAVPAQAQEQSAAGELRARIAATGTYEFSALEKDEHGRTVCEETWIFRADSTYTITSGGQRVEGTWLVEVDEEDLRYLWLTCRRPDRITGPDGKASTWWTDETSWGHIRPASQAR